MRRRGLQELGVRSAEGHRQLQGAVHRRAPVTGQVALGQRTPHAQLRHAVEVGLDRGRIELRAVAEGHAVAEGEGPGRGIGVGRPAGGQPGLDVTGPGVLVGERVDDLAHRVDRVVARHLLRVDAARVAADGELQRAARLGRAARRGRGGTASAAGGEEHGRDQEGDGEASPGGRAGHGDPSEVLRARGMVGVRPDRSRCWCGTGPRRAATRAKWCGTQRRSA